jgi:carboxyl-terminal processing protease
VPEGLGTVWEAWHILNQEFVNREDLDPKKLSEGAIRGMLEALDDPYSSYLDPRHHQLQREDFRGVFEGIGAQVTMREGKLTIVAPIPDTPAERAGIRPGDIILEVDGESTEGITLMEAVFKIRGPKGTPVTLLVLHKGEEKPVPITIIRDVIKVRTVRVENLPDGVVHLTITSFLENTDEELKEALRQIKRDGARGIVLDLRNNGGGLLDTTVRVASQFLKTGLVLYEVDGRGERRDWQVRPGGLATDIPMVVLVNGFSASGAEVLAGALRDHDRAKLIGERTFGKGSVNTMRGLSDGSAIYFTIARWYTPKGDLIEGKGLEPNIQVEMPPHARDDPQMEKALEVLRTIMEGR